MKKRNMLLFALSGLFCLNLLCACSSDSGSDAEAADASESSGVTSSSASDAGSTVQEEGYQAGLVLSAEGSAVTLQMYQSLQDEDSLITDPSSFTTDGWALTAETRQLAIPEDILHTVNENGSQSAALEEIQPGSVLLIQEDPEDDSLADVILEQDTSGQEQRVAEVTAVDQDSVELLFSQSEEDAPLNSYVDADLSGYTQESTVQTFTLGEDLTVYGTDRGYLEQGEISDIQVGNMVAVTLSPEGELTQVIQLTVPQADESLS